MGTAIHEAAAAAARLLLPGARAEDLTVHFGGLMGHVDLYRDGRLRDIKTKGFTLQVENVRQNGPSKGERFQVHTYAAGAILAGLEVHTVELAFLARDSGEEYLFSEPFSMEVVGEAMAWLEDVRRTPVNLLERDFRPDSAVCKGCKFFTRCWQMPRGREERTVLFLDNPDIAHWARQLEDAQKAGKKAGEDEKDARGALEALRTVSRPGEKEYIAVPGVDKVVRISMNKGRRTPDMPQIANDYKRAGARPPMRTGDPVVKIALVKPPKETDD
jgi:hypothetical protein